ncbi:MAG: SH3 domain-containing protein [Firmicutes bacterium]|nr:SH3 domain-containing protein [Bacillota bacterium]
MSSIGRTILYIFLIIAAVAVIVGAAMLIMNIVSEIPSEDTDTDGADTTASDGSEGDITTELLRTPDAEGTTSDDTEDGTAQDTISDDTVVLDSGNSSTDAEGVTITTYSTSLTLYALYNVNARMSYSTSSDIYFIIYKGDSVTVTGETSNGWYQILYGIYTAYIRQDLLTADASASAVVTTTYDTPVTMYTFESVNVRSGPTTSSSIYEMYSAGVGVTVVGETDNGWYVIEYGDGTAYINDDYLSETMPETTGETETENAA